MNEKIRKRMRVYGIVQGVGFRPFVSRIADKSGISGSVCNKGPYVEIFAEGSGLEVASFRRMLTEDAPERSQILKVEEKVIAAEGSSEFLIIESEKVRGEIFVSPDIATCPRCREELFDKNDRRYLHPFINCTACGPRVTILDSMPYDRVRTSMGEFPMCPDCEYEYTHPETRRYHAQPVCCNDCGPELYILEPGAGNASGLAPREPGGRSAHMKPEAAGGEAAVRDAENRAEDRAEDLAEGAAQKPEIIGTDALLYTREVLRNGGIAAVKGIGGFHLCCDAASPEAVARLRKLKDRPFKPFAVMVKDLETLKRECVVEPGQEKFLDGPQKPILLLRKKSGPGVRMCADVAPDNPNIGAMLPYAPVQMLLFDYPDGKPMTDCFIMTSANPRGAPICREDADVLNNLGGMCDVILSNNRKIRLRADDSVMAWHGGGPYMIRRSRGYAPLPLMMGDQFQRKGRVLGIGGELKNTFCLAKDSLFYPSPYIGDLSDLRSVEALKQAVTRMEGLLEIEPEVVCCDLHPRYNSSMAARELGLPVTAIQHHYAHVLSCVAENDYFEPVIGVSFDGTGYGTDGTVWGGEFLIADTDGFRRAGCIGPFDQAGGDLAPKEGWRIAAALLREVYGACGKEEHIVRALGICGQSEMDILSAMIDKRINCVKSSSMGRLFDAASAVLGLRRVSTCEGEASMVLQFAAERFRETKGADAVEELSAAETVGSGSDLCLLRSDDGGGEFRIPAAGIIGELAERRLGGEDVDRLAYVFHRQAAALIAAGCEEARRESGLETVALTGGVMQNLLLLDLTVPELKKRGFRVLTHRMIPANDGGIGVGQALYALTHL